MPDLTEDLLRQATLFSDLPDDEIKQLSQTLHVLDLPRGAVLFHEGEIGDGFYLIRAGQVEVVKALGQPEEWVTSVRNSGEYIGEMSLLNRDGLRTASVRARVPTQLLQMTRADFDGLLSRQPALAYTMVQVLSQRLSQANNQAISDLREKNRRLEEAYNELKEAQAQIIIKEKLEHELQVARQVQASLLPQQVPQLAGWEFAAHWEPAREVAGDFYDFIAIQPDQLGIVIADVADKGMPSALFMALSRSILRACLLHSACPSDRLAQANRLICADSNDSMFVTLFFVALNAVTGTVDYLNAGHNPTLFYQKHSDQLDWLSHTGMPLGIDPDTTYGQRSLSLEPGDLLLLYTDGVPDATDVGGNEFGTKRLWQLVYDHRHDPAADIVARLKTALVQHVGETQPIDDITIVAVKRGAA